MSAFPYASLPGMDFGQSLGQGLALGQRSLGLRQDQQQFDAARAQQQGQFDTRMGMDQYQFDAGLAAQARAQQAVLEAKAQEYQRKRNAIVQAMASGMLPAKIGERALLRMETDVPFDVQENGDPANKFALDGLKLTYSQAQSDLEHAMSGFADEATLAPLRQRRDEAFGALQRFYSGGQPQAAMPAPADPLLRRSTPAESAATVQAWQRSQTVPPGGAMYSESGDNGAPTLTGSLSPPAPAAQNAAPPAASINMPSAVAQAIKELGPGADRNQIKFRAQQILQGGQ